MATVRITDTIRSHVRDKLNSMYGVRIKLKTDELAAMHVADSVYNHLFSSETQHLIEKLNSHELGVWSAAQSNISLEISYMFKGNLQSRTFDSAFKTARCLPLAYTGRWPDKRLKILEEMECHKHVAALFSAIDDLVVERDATIKQLVDGVLQTCSTLRQTLEIWPTAMDFMPDEVRARHYAVVTKTKTEIDPNMVDESTKLALIKLRLTTGS